MLLLQAIIRKGLCSTVIRSTIRIIVQENQLELKQSQYNIAHFLIDTTVSPQMLQLTSWSNICHQGLSQSWITYWTI